MGGGPGVFLSLCGFVVFIMEHFMLSHAMLFILVFFSVLFGILITWFGEEWAGLCASCVFFFLCASICPFSLALGVRDWL